MQTQTAVKTLSPLVAAAALAVLTRGPAYASSGTWSYDGNDNWSNSARWTPAVVPGTAAGDVVSLTNNITANRTVTVNTTSRTAGVLVFGDVSSPYYNFTLAASGGASLTLDNSGVGASVIQTNTASTADALSVPLVLADNLSVTNRGSLTIAGAISGAGKSLTKNGAGYLTLSGTNTYSGGTVVNGGVLSLLKTNSLPSSGAVSVANGCAFGIGVGGAGAFGSSDVDALYANALPNVTLGTSAIAGVDTTPGSFTYSSSLSGTRAFGKLGRNNLILPVANNHTGATWIYGGVLELEHASALPGGLGTTGGSSALIFNGGVLGLGVGNFTRSLASAGTASGVNFTGDGGWAAFNADRVVNLGGNGATISWGTANTGFNSRTLILGAPTATHTVELQNPLNLGTGSRTVQVDDGAAAIDAVISAPISGTSANTTLYKSGAGTLALTATNAYAAQTWLYGGGTLLLTGAANIGTPIVTNNLFLGQQYNGTGTLQYNSSATSYFANVNISQSGAVGTLNQTAGMIVVSGGVNLTPGADSTSFLNLSGGTLAVAGALGIGQRGISAGYMTLSGSGVLTAGVLYVADIANPASPKPSFGYFTQSGGTATVGSLVLARTSSDTNSHIGTVEFNGGVLRTASITGGVATAGGINTSTFNFNGGTLKPTASGSKFMQDLTAANVKEGGAVIDTDGYDVTVAQALLHASGAAASPLTKSGAGNLTLAGTNTLVGPITVNAGTLTLSGAAQFASGTLTTALTNNGALVFAGSADQTLAGGVCGSGSLTKNGAGTLTLAGATPYSGATSIGAGKLAVTSSGSLSNSAVTLASGATLGLQVLAGYDAWRCKSLTLSGGSVTVALRFHRGSPSGTTAPVWVGGDFVNNGTLNVSLDGASVTNGVYPLIRYTGSISGSGSLGTVALPAGGVGALVDNSANQTIDLSVTTPVSPLVWNGGTGDWDIGATANWSGLRSTYQDGDLVLFDDTSLGGSPLAVSVAAAVNPNNVLFNNASKTYTLTGPGALSGVGGVIKSGAGGLTLALPNVSSGGVSVEDGAGTVTVFVAPAQDGLGSGPVAIGAGSTLVLNNTNGSAASVSKANVFGGSGTLGVLFATNTTARSTTLSGLSGFAGVVRVGSAGSATGDKLDVYGVDAPGATVQVAASNTLQVGRNGAPVRLGGVSVSGSGNAEASGALRFGTSASLLEAPVTILGDATLASDAAGATLSGSITGSAQTGETNVLTQGTASSTAGFRLSGAIADGSNGGRVALVQSKGSLTLAGSSTYGGGTTVNGGGTLVLGANNALPVGGSVVLGGTNGVGNGVGSVALGDYSQTIDSLAALSVGTSYNTITVSPGQALGITGAAGLSVGLDAGVSSETRLKMAGGGALVMSHASANVTVGKGQFDESGTGTGVLDLSDLGSVTLGSAAAPIGEVRVAYGQMCAGTLTLSNTNNLITASALRISDSQKLNSGSGTMVLGAGANTLAVDTLVVGLYKGNGTVKFASQTAGSSGTVTIGGRTRETAELVVGSKGAMPSGAVASGTLDLRGHAATINAGTVTIGREDNNTGIPYSGGAVGTVYFDGGSFAMTNLTMAYRSGLNTGVNAKATATLSVSGGEVTVRENGSFTLATQSGTGSATATLNLGGGTLRTYADILTGPSNCTSTINLSGGLLDMTGRAIGQGVQTVTVFNVTSGTLMNLGEFNNGAPLVKTGAGTLTLDGTNTYSGATVVSNGVLRLTGGACLPPTADLYVSSAGGATCALNYAGDLALHALYVDGVRLKGSRYAQDNLPAVLSGNGAIVLPFQGTMLFCR